MSPWPHTDGCAGGCRYSYEWPPCPGVDALLARLEKLEAVAAAAADVTLQEGRYYERDGSGESRFVAVVPKASLAALRAALDRLGEDG